MQSFFNLDNFSFSDLIDKDKPWLSLDQINTYIESKRRELKDKGFVDFGSALVHPKAKIDPSVKISGQALIDAESEISKNVWLRGGVVIGKNSFVGLGLEVKHSIIMDYTRIPHLSYIADSILGSHVNIGAGTITANWKGGWDNKTVSLHLEGKKISTEKEKFGALISDDVYLGCNNVTTPGTVVGKNVLTYPLCLLRGEIPSNSIVKNKAETEIVDKE